MHASEYRNIRNAAHEIKEAADELEFSAIILPRRLEERRQRLSLIAEELHALAAELRSELNQEDEPYQFNQERPLEGL